MLLSSHYYWQQWTWPLKGSSTCVMFISAFVANDPVPTESYTFKKKREKREENPLHFAKKLKVLKVCHASCSRRRPSQMLHHVVVLSRAYNHTWDLRPPNNLLYCCPKRDIRRNGGAVSGPYQDHHKMFQQAVFS